MHPDSTTLARFWSKVDRSGGPDACWPWLGAPSEGGYGRFRVGGKKVRAHRFAYEATYGPLPNDLDGCHTCDNPPCCNPAHVFPGTAKQNVEDAIHKGRWHTPEHFKRGEQHQRAKLTAAQVVEIRRRYVRGHRKHNRGNAGALAAEFGVAPRTIARIARGERRTEVN